MDKEKVHRLSKAIYPKKGGIENKANLHEASRVDFYYSTE